MPYAATLEGFGRSMRRVAYGQHGLAQFDAEIPPEVLEKIKAAMSDAVADGIEAGTKRVEQRYEAVATWGKVQVVASVLAAAAAIGILAVLIWKKR
jgi:hypothetical protein